MLTFVQNDPGTFCVNHNWHPIAVLIRSFPSQMKTWACTLKDESLCDPANIGITPEWVVASRATATCTLPSQYGFANPPIEDVTEYSLPQPGVRAPVVGRRPDRPSRSSRCDRCCSTPSR
ncbi:MAG: hypothetical protein MZV65_18685 [Chromatiales bacterium]|nr:hypothetical protein [Chromatiales bacterium]